MYESEPIQGLKGYDSSVDAYNKYAPKNGVEKEIVTLCNEMAEFLIKKNRAYGNSALEPVRVFSKADNQEQLLVRIDDKLSRFFKGTEFPGDNDIDDLIGYLVLLKIAMRDNWR
jgi:hypothetical protein